MGKEDTREQNANKKGTLGLCLLFTIHCSEAIGEVATFQWFRKQTTKCYCERSSWNECSMLKCNRRFHLHGKGLFYLPALFILFHLLLLFTSFPRLNSLVLYQEFFLKPPHWSWLFSLKWISSLCNIPEWWFLSKDTLKNGKFLLTVESFPFLDDVPQQSSSPLESS